MMQLQIPVSSARVLYNFEASLRSIRQHIVTSLCTEDSIHNTIEKEQPQDPSTALEHRENAIPTKGEAKEEHPVDSTSSHSLGCAKLIAGQMSSKSTSNSLITHTRFKSWFPPKSKSRTFDSPLWSHRVLFSTPVSISSTTASESTTLWSCQK